MKKSEVRERNLKNLFAGNFFLAISRVLISFFLAFYLKQEGLSVLEIGGLFTAGLAFGSLVFGIFYSEFLRKIKLRVGLYLYSFFGVLNNFVFFLFPTSTGALVVKPLEKVQTAIGNISQNSTIQHNSTEKTHREASSRDLAIETSALVLGLVLAVISVRSIGFEYSFLAFGLLALPSIFFFFRIREDTRFKVLKGKKLPKFYPRLKILISGEVLYWFSLAVTGNLVITFLVIDKFQGSIIWLAAIFASLHFSIMLTTYLTKRFFNNRNLYGSSMLGMVLLFLSAVMVIISTDLYFVFAAFVIEGVGAGIWVPSKTALVWKYTQKENRERVSGRVSGLGIAVQSLGPLAGGFLTSSWSILGPFYVRAGVSVLVLGIYFYLWRKDK